jgi:hypothetical protein
MPLVVQSARCHIPEDLNVNRQSCESLITHFRVIIVIIIIIIIIIIVIQSRSLPISTKVLLIPRRINFLYA